MPTPEEEIQGLQPIVFTDKVQAVPYTDDVNDIAATEVNAFRDRITSLINGLKYVLSIIPTEAGGGVDYSAQISEIESSIQELEAANQSLTNDKLNRSEYNALFVDSAAIEKKIKDSYIPITSFSTTNFKGLGTDASPLEINNITSANISDFESAVQAQIQAYMAANPS